MITKATMATRAAKITNEYLKEIITVVLIQDLQLPFDIGILLFCID